MTGGEGDLQNGRNGGRGKTPTALWVEKGFSKAKGDNPKRKTSGFTQKGKRKKNISVFEYDNFYVSI